MMNLLYCIILKPLILLFEFIFDNAYDISNNIVLSVLIISFAVSVLCLPLYLRADEFQEEEKQIQKKIHKKSEAIKRNYKGDEKFLLLQTLYRQNNYHPIMGLRLSLSLILQIPFFLAAYIFFSHLSILNGVSLGIIKDLTKPDGMLLINSIHVNILPVLMTIINIIAGIVYTKSAKFETNKLLYTISFVFLVLLYNAPSILVLYWTFNNLFSLIKNICLLKLSRSTLIKSAFITALTAFFVFLFYYNLNLIPGFIILFFFALFNIKQFWNFNFCFADKKLFILTILCFFGLVGLLIPSNVIATSPIEFIIYETMPSEILIHTVAVFFGVFIFWGMVIYYLLSENIKKIISVILPLSLFIGITNMIIIKMPIAHISNIMIFQSANINFSQPLKIKILYLIILTILVLGYIFILYKKKNRIIRNFLVLIMITCIFATMYNIYQMSNKTRLYLEQNKQALKHKNDKYIHLSKTKKNILILFADRAINSYLPIIFKECPKLYKQFEGFTYYPNTLSYAGYTILGYYPILGGYEYTPFNINESGSTFETKQKEASAMLPVIFSNNGFKTSVINPTEYGWAVSSWGRLSIKQISSFVDNDLYKQYNINTARIPNSIAKNLKTDIDKNRADLAKRNLIYYSFYSILNSKLRNFLYDNGFYHNPCINIRGQYSGEFLKNYSELYFIKNLTDFNEKENTFTIFNNSLTHAPTILNYPNYDISGFSNQNYIPPIQIDDGDWSLSHYHVNAALLRLLGEYFDYLRKNNVYDNTKIIIVADHGFGYNLQNPYMGQFEADYYLPYNPLLLVKDFNSNENIKIDYNIMTNADVPYLATKGIIKNPKNPFTGKEISTSEKTNGIIIKHDVKWQPELYIGKKKFITSKDKFLYIKDDPTDYKNWKVNLTYKEALKLYNQNKGK